MSICYPYFLIALFVGFIAAKVPNLYDLDARECTAIRNKYRIYTLSICVILVLFSSFRMITASSIDEYAYRNRFDYYSNLDFISVIELTTEPIFACLVWISTKLFSTNQGIIIITGFLTVVLLMAAIKKYSSAYSFACVILFVTGILYTTFNGIQQYLAAALIVCAFDAAYEKNIKKYLLIVIVCTLIHNASIFLLLFYPLANAKTGSRKMWIYDIVFLIVGLLFYRAVPELADKYGIFVDYSNIISSGHYGVQYITILINLVPAICILLCRRNLIEDTITSVFSNITILHAMIYLLASIDTYIARLAIFTAPFTVICLSRIMRYFKNAAILKFLAVILYSIVCYLQLKGITYNFNFTF